MLNKDEFMEIAWQRYEAWQKSQQGQTSGYDYEKTFDEMMIELGGELLQGSVGELPKNAKKKRKIKTRYSFVEVPQNHLLSQSNGNFRISPYLQELECYFGQEEAYERGSELLEKVLRIPMNKKELERVSKYYGSAIEESLEAESLATLPKAVETDEKVYAMMDGSMIYSRLGEWKETKLGRIFSSKSCCNVSKKRHWIKDSVYVSHVGDCKAFFKKFAPYTDCYDNNLVFIGDGASWIWNWVESQYPEATQILDYYHAIEHLGKFAKIIFKKEKQRDTWMEQQTSLIKEDQCCQVIETIRNIECKTKKKKEEQSKLVNYYQNNLKRMQYKTFRQKGLLIGSGAIESAHRTVIQKRLKLSGQRWTIEGAQQVLNLRVAHMSGYWDKVINLIDGKKAA